MRGWTRPAQHRAAGSRPASRRRTGRQLAALVGVGLTIALGTSGCGTMLGQQSGEDRARDAVRSTATQLAAVIDKGRPRNVAASELAYRYSDASAPAAADGAADSTGGADGSDDVSYTAIEALSWTGTTYDQDGARLVMRISAHVPSHSATTIGDASYSAGDASACYSFRVFGFQEDTPTTAEVVGCPPTPAAPPPSPAPAPALPADASLTLETVLAGATEESLSGDLLAAFPDGMVPTDPSGGARLVRDSGAEDGVLAAAVGISGTTDCTVGTRQLDGTVRTWHPQDISLAAGEAGCTIANALHPVITH